VPPDMVQEIFGGFLAATTGLTALFMILRFKLKAKGQIPGEKLDRLVESQENILAILEDLRDEIGAQDRQVAELSGRVEFAERLLAQANEQNKGN
jgi:hypothetical protein